MARAAVFGEVQGGPPLPMATVSLRLLGRRQGDDGHHRDHLASMSLSPDQSPLPSSPPKSKLTPEERRARQADRLTTIRLRMLIFRKLENCGITTPAEIGAALGMPPAEATKLLRSHHWREGDVARLEAVAARLGVQVPGP